VIDAIAAEPQFVDHLAPVWHALPSDVRGTFFVDAPLSARAAARGIDAMLLDAESVRRREAPPAARSPRGAKALVASIGDTKIARRLGYGDFARLEHGAGQTYVGNRTGSYAGGPDNQDASLVLVPNEYAADHWRRAYPAARVEVVGCPKVATLPEREPGPLTVAVTFHWDCSIAPETQPAREFIATLPALAARFRVIGHAHPKGDWPRQMGRVYARFGIPFVRDFEDVCRQADVLVFDNSSVGFEFAALGRPVVVLNARTYRRKVSHGGRFWDWASVGVNANAPDELIPAVESALMDPIGVREERERVVAEVYSVRGESAETRGGGDRAVGRRARGGCGMSLSGLLDHRVYVSRKVDGADDDYGHPVTTQEVGESFAAAIQPKSIREVVAIDQAGSPVGDWTLFFAPRVVTEADALIHDAAACPKVDTADLPTCRFEITGVRNAAGRGHHLEVDARLVGTSAGVEGS
jgi:hypothetical protein